MVTVEPEPAAIPPHDSVYHCQEAPGDNDPTTCKVVLSPAHTVGELELAETGSAGTEATLKFIIIHAEEQVPFSARTK